MAGATVFDDLPPVDRPISTKPNHPKTLTPQTIVLDPRKPSHPDAPPVSPLLYSGFVEHLGRCIYGGIASDPANPSDKSLLLDQGNYPGGTGKKRLGLRKDVLKVWSKDGDFKCPMMRYPGGNYVSNYLWTDAIGPREERKKRRELAWATTESNLFGTDEFIDWCRASGCEPYLCLNMGSGSLREALDWLEYCNGTGDTYWAEQRRKNTGRDEPHNVRIWGLGNEQWGEHQVGHLPAAQYADKCASWAQAFKMVDPTLKLVLCGHEGTDDWDRILLERCIDIVDLHSIHMYTMIDYRSNKDVNGLEYEVNVFGPAAAERNIQHIKAMIDVINVDRIYQGKTSRDVKIAFDEWNVWDPVIAHPNEGNEQLYNYTDMLGFCAWLNVLVRQSKDCPVACLAQGVNDIAPIITKPDGILYQSIYYPFRLFSNYMRDGFVLSMAPFLDTYDGPTHPATIQHLGLCPSYIDAVAMSVPLKGDEISVRVSLLNRHLTADWEAELDFKGFECQSVEIHEMFSENLDSANTWRQPDLIKPTITKLSGKEWEGYGSKRTLKKHSWAFFIFNGKARA